MVGNVAEFSWARGIDRPLDEYEQISLVHHYGPGPLGYHMKGVWAPEEAKLKCDWSKFRDPSKYIYKNYMAAYNKKEANLDHTLEIFRREGISSKGLATGWVGVLKRFLPPLRHMKFGLSRSLEYIGRYGCHGTLATASTFQAFDEIRHAQRLCEYSVSLGEVYGDCGNSRDAWLNDPLFQPMREYIERLWALKDWTEMFVAQNLVFEPIVQTFCFDSFGRLARDNGDVTTAVIADYCWEEEKNISI